MKKFLLFGALAAMGVVTAQAQLYWNTNGASNAFTSANWSASPSGPFTTAWSASSDVIFDAASTAGFSTTTVGDITVNADTTINANSTLSSKSGGSTVTVADGVVLTWTTQARTATGANNIWTKNGAGTWNIGAPGGSDAGVGSSFTLNAGTVIVTGQRAFGGPNSVLTINGGLIQSSTGVAFANSNVVIGGNFGFSGTGNDTYSGAVSLGSSTRTITNTSTGSRTLGGVISGSSASTGLTLAGSGTTTLAGANTYTGDTTVTGGRMNLADNAELRFDIGSNGVNNQLINSGGTINLEGDFVFDLTGAGTIVGNSWTITSGTIGYAGSFFVKSTLGVFNDLGSNLWGRHENGVDYQFSESTGVLSVVPEPAAIVLLAASGLGFGGYVVRRRRRSR